MVRVQSTKLRVSVLCIALFVWVSPKRLMCFVELYGTLFVCVETWICGFPESMVESRTVWKHLPVV